METFERNWSVGMHDVVDKWFLMEGPGLITGIVLVYLLFVLKVGPDFMKHRKPFELKKTLIVYNGVQVLFSIFLIVKICLADKNITNIGKIGCFKIGGKEKLSIPFLDATWWYFFAKVTELLDTVFFVLRKKSNQVTFLHVYHHTTMAFFTWCFLKYQPSEIAGLIGVINSGVHVIMYAYYMVAAMGPEYQKYLWWKKYMTIIQLTQFVTILIFLFSKVFSDCGISRGVLYFFTMNTILFFYLFFDFYIKSYKKKPAVNMVNGNHQTEIKMMHKPASHEDEVYSKISKDVVMSNEESALRQRQ